MTGIERIETFRKWRALVAMNPEQYRIVLLRDKLGINFKGIKPVLEEVVGEGHFSYWNKLEELPAWDPENPPAIGARSPSRPPLPICRCAPVEFSLKRAEEIARAYRFAYPGLPYPAKKPKA